MRPNPVPTADTRLTTIIGRMHIGLNAHLLTTQAGYRSAGIHGYMLNTMLHLPAAAPNGWRFTALIGAACDLTLPGFELRRSRIDTRSPLHRIAWEQAIQPFQLGAFNLYHAQAFVSPLLQSSPSVVTVFDLSFLHYPAGLTVARRLYLRLFTPISCRRARRVIAISASTARDLSTAFRIPADKIDIALGAHDAARFAPLQPELIEAFRREHNLPERFWLFVGTIEPRKNLATLIDAYAALPVAERLPLVIGGGKGWMYDDVFAAVERHGLNGVIRFAGFLPAETLPLWYNSAETFIYPSVYEGFGLPVVEAMACGTPVITSTASSLPEAAGDAALQVNPHDTQAISDALRLAFRDVEWRMRARAAGLNHASRFSWIKTAEATIESYRKGLE
jgi:glycosyltransferase involved in cell wall biosynthesis